MRGILAPTLSGQFVATLTITQLVPSGSQVKKGDLLVEFDRQSQMREFIDRQADYTKFQNQVIQEQSKESAARAKDETEIKEAESGLSKAELEMQKLEVVFSNRCRKGAQDAGGGQGYPPAAPRNF